MANMNQEIIDWLTVHLLPFEAQLRARLRWICAQSVDVDDVVQEVYCRVMQLNSVAHVQDPRAFMVQMAKNIVTDRLRRDAVVSFEAVSNLEEFSAQDAAPSVERVMLARSELAWIMSLVGRLPERCREVFKARRIYGLSQREAAESLGLSEKAVEYETAKGTELFSDMIERSDYVPPNSQQPAPRKLKRSGKRHVGDQ